ncbi:MAG: hypothetical protein POH28_12550 [Acidocella sp.]|nr:hypothetical protein [Acidocella sp.]
MANLAQELADALQMLMSVAVDERTHLPRGALFTDMALNGARVALAKAEAAGLLDTPPRATKLHNS